MRILKEPLLHFLLIGIAMFIVYDAISVHADSGDSREIVVTRDNLLTYVQYRAKAFDPQRFNQVLDDMPADELQGYIDNYVREEALYREAKALNLDRNDYVARRRLIQQLEFITSGFVSEVTEITTDEVQAYFRSHNENYHKPAEITFTHVFFNKDRRGAEQARTMALQTLKQLNAKQVPFHEGLLYSDRFLYHANYVNKQADEITSHFGEAMQQQLFALAPEDGVWRGPYSSSYGEHLVMVTRLRPGYVPELAEVREKVHQDALRDQQEAELEEAIGLLVRSYRIKVSEELRQRASKEKASKQHENASL